MSLLRVTLEGIHVVALGLWMGFIVASGVVAAIVFPMMKELDPTLPAFSSYGGEHWRIAAGQIAAKVFFIGDVVQFAAIFLCISTLALSCVLGGLTLRRVSTLVRSSLLGLATLLAAYQLMLLGPKMNDLSRRYWDAAGAGENETATALREQFARLHPEASAALGVTALVVMATIFASIWSIAGDVTGGNAARVPDGGTPLEPPALLKGMS